MQLRVGEGGGIRPTGNETAGGPTLAVAGPATEAESWGTCTEMGPTRPYVLGPDLEAGRKPLA